MSFFTSLFSVPRLRRAAIRGTGIALCVLVFLFAGCTLEPERGALDGVWKLSGTTYYNIDTVAETVEHVDGNYKGTIVNNPDYSAVSGILIIKITEYHDVSYGPGPEYTPVRTENPANIGKHTALYWNDLTAESVKFCDAWQNYVHIIKDTEAEALATFTPDTVANYLFGGTWGDITPYTK